MQDFVDCLALVQDDARLGLHGDDFDRADGLEIAQPAVRDRADTAGASAEEAADAGFYDGAGIAAQLPPSGSGGVFEHTETRAWAADGNPVRSDLFDSVYACEVEHYAAGERYGLAVVAGARAACRDGDSANIAARENANDFIGGDCWTTASATLSSRSFFSTGEYQ